MLVNYFFVHLSRSETQTGWMILKRGKKMKCLVRDKGYGSAMMEVVGREEGKGPSAPETGDLDDCHQRKRV